MKRHTARNLSVILMALTACSSGKGTKKEFLSEADFKRMDKIDIHCHINSRRSVFMEQAADDNFRILSINTDLPGLPVERQRDAAIAQQLAFPDRLAYLTSFSMKGWDEAGWQEKTRIYLEGSFQKGAIGVKIWKNIGMVEKDKEGRFIMIDDPRFDLVLGYLEEKGIPVCGHLGEPRNCWLSLEQMTVNNDRSYYGHHPEYHMFLHPECPSYEQQIQARDRMLQKHPKLKFMGAHLGSMEWSIDLLAEHFDRFPNLTVDLAERICHIQVQAQSNYEKVRDFFIKYQDRILYGTDKADGSEEGDPEELRPLLHQEWLSDWKFFTTDETMTSRKVNGEFKGLRLPREVIEKIYFRNAEKLFPGI